MLIRTKLMVSFVSVAALIILLVSVVTFLNARDAIKQEAIRKLNAISEFKEAMVFLYLDRLKERARDFSSDGFIKKRLAKINSNKAKQVVEELNAHIKKSKKPLAKDIVNIEILTLNGKIIATTASNKTGADKYEKERILKGEDQIFATDIHEEENGDLVIEVFAPIKDHHYPDKTIGILVNRYNAVEISEILRNEAMIKYGVRTTLRDQGKTGETYIVNQNRVMITESLFIKNATFKLKVNTFPVKKALEKNEESLGIWTDYRGVRVIGSSMILDIGDFKWILITEQDVSEAYAPINALLIYFSIFGAIMLFLSIVIGYFISRSISEPIQVLQRRIELIRRGEKGIKVGTESRDEIGELSRAFDKMLVSLLESSAESERITEDYARLIGEANAPIFGIDKKGRIDEWNQSVASITGFSKDDVLGKDLIAEFIDDDDKELVKNTLERALRGEKTANFEFALHGKLGNRVEILLSISSRRDADSNIMGVVGVGQDITELIESRVNLEQKVLEKTKDINRALSDAEQARDRLDGILKSIADGLIVLDIYDRILTMNRVAENILGVRFSEVINRPIDFAILDKELREKIKETIGKKSTKNFLDFNMPGEDPGHPRSMRASTSVIFDKEGKETGTVMMIHDLAHTN